ncbi:MAG TPA: GYF domain-containing protein [Flavisolibacter sp.]|nr:GYF domain-containing protein [Flavisolibacter sp.]
MKKVYLLLRNNQELGPFTIDEILQQQLSANDLVWVEGQSTAWCHPGELKELQQFYKKPSLPADGTPAARPPQPPARGEIEEKAEALRQKALSFSPTYYYHRQEMQEELRGHYALRQDEIELVDHTKDTKYSGAELLKAAMVTVIVGLGFWGGQTLIKDKKALAAVRPVQIVSGDSHAALPPATAVVHTDTLPPASQPQANAGTPPVAMPSQQASLTARPITVQQTPAVQETTQTAAIPMVARIEDNLAINPPPRTEEAQEKKARPEPAMVAEVKEVKVEEKEKDKGKETGKEEKQESPEAESEKRKTLGEAIKGIFKKKKKKDD